MSDVRQSTGVPVALDFTSTSGTPIVVDSATGLAYVLIAGVVTQIGGPITTATSLTASGSGQSDALQLTSTVNQVTTVAANTGVKLITDGAAGRWQLVYNSGLNPLSIYPQSGASISPLSANAGISLPVKTGILLFALSSTAWVGILSS